MNFFNKERKVGISTGTVISVSIIYILLAFVMLFLPSLKEIYIIYLISAVLIILGILTIVRYFLSGSFHDIGTYGFSGGVLLVVSGSCLLIRAEQIAGFLSVFLGICILLTSTIKIQNAIDLNCLNNKYWCVFLIISLLFVFAAIWLILDPFKLKAAAFIYHILIVDGLYGLLSTGIVAISLHSYNKKIEQEPQLPEICGPLDS